METYHEIKAVLRNRVAESGDKPGYLLLEEELKEGLHFNIFDSIDGPTDRGDGTTVTCAIFEGNRFILVAQN